MKHAMMILGFVLAASITQAHDLKYTLIQNGAKPSAQCSMGNAVKIDILKSKNKNSAYLIFSSADEDAQVVHEQIVKATVSTKGHDLEVYRNDEVKLELASVGEGDLPGTAKLSSAASALKVWLNTYGEGSSAKQVNLNCRPESL